MEELSQEICLNEGGIAKIQIALATQIDTFFRIEFAPDTALYRKNRKRTKAGTSIVYQISFNIAKMREDIENWLNDYAEKYFLFQITDLNGYTSEIGNLQYPLELVENFTTGRNQADKNEYDFNFEVEIPL